MSRGTMLSNLRSVSLVSLLTMGSRVLGLVRDILFFSCFGTSAAGAAFIFAFTLPNLFRRMLGEGALASAVVPVLSDAFEAGGRESGFALLNKVLTRLLSWLIPMVAICCLLAWWAGRSGWIADEKWARGIELVAWTMPYLILISLTAMIVAALNVRKRFGVGACTPILLNLAMITTLLWFGGDSDDVSLDFLAYALCGGVLIGGFLQLLAPCVDFTRGEGWRPRLDFTASDELRRVWALFLPGVLGAAVLQINTMVSRAMAYSLDEEGAISVLFIAARLIEFPLGVFAIAVTTVVFPMLAGMRSQKDDKGYFTVFHQGLRLTLAVTLPAAVGLILLREPILGFLFDWGRFGEDDVGRTAPVLAVVALGMPFYAMAAFFTRGFHARKDMRTPVRGAVISLGMNSVLSAASVIFLREWAILGLAAANVLASMFQGAYLLVKFRRLDGAASLPLRLGLGSIAGACLCLGIVVWGGWEWITSLEQMSGKGQATLAVCGLIPVVTVIYFVILGRLGFPDAGLLRSMLDWRREEES
ncbi:MAG: murein biosynthesis integral membrane protein MurJ [Opitutales bacterium]